MNHVIQVVVTPTSRILMSFLVIGAVFVSQSVTAYAGTDAAFSQSQRTSAQAAFKAAEKSKTWKKARASARKIKDPLFLKSLNWYRYLQPNSGASFQEIAAFIERHSNWPHLRRMTMRAEEAMNGKTTDAVALQWFSKHAPVGAKGRVRYAQALLNANKVSDAKGLLRGLWVSSDFGRSEQIEFYRRYRKHLTRDDHWQRLDRLLWNGSYTQAKRMYRLVSKDRRALADARLVLRRMRGGVDGAIGRVPASLRRDPGLIYERLRWRRRKDRNMDARALLDDPPDNQIRPDLWWLERKILARRALDSGHISEAYRIVKEHGLTNGGKFAEAEWLAGWIALRFLRDYEVAEKHFRGMFEAVRYPISVARGAYWRARALEVRGKSKEAAEWYRKASKFSQTYYGQLAALQLDYPSTISLPDEPIPTKEERAAFEKLELVHAIRLLGKLGLERHISPFTKAIAAMRDQATWKVLAASLARDLGRKDIAVSISKKATLGGHFLPLLGYPVLALPKLPKRAGRVNPEPSLVLSVIRQESLFDIDARSRAGARGLMQIMPATARLTAKALKMRYSKSRLLSDPKYNLTLGQSYMARLLKRFEGSYVLSIAAYNAGPSRARAWIEENGDPRDPTIDVVDWIEQVPYSETRNYIQRVLENVQIYRARLAEKNVALLLDRDLRR